MLQYKTMTENVKTTPLDKFTARNGDMKLPTIHRN